jgi:tetratricopeptide (TPR) repeat protein
MINVMDNLFDMGKIDEAWVLLENLKEESASENFDYGRQYWELRMNYLECKMHLENSNFDKAELIIQDNIERANKNQMKKREGSFLRLLGEIQLQKDELNNAVGTLKNSIGILEKVSNPKLLWETYSILATIYQKLGRSSKSSEAWGAARNWITTVADDLSDMELKNSFLNSQQIKNIFLKCDHS